MYHTLVRDKVPWLMEAKWMKPIYEKLSYVEREPALFQKLEALTKKLQWEQDKKKIQEIIIDMDCLLWAFANHFWVHEDRFKKSKERSEAYWNFIWFTRLSHVLKS